MQLAENVILGLDIGIGSIGWALIQQDPETLETRLLSNAAGQPALGVRAFNVPEEDKTKKLLNVTRREKRMQRRVIARRAQRMRTIRTLLCKAGLPDDRTERALFSRLDPWILRKEGLSRLLSAHEWAAVLIHMCKHRGFKSNSKRDKSSKGETGKMLKAVGLLAQEVAERQCTLGALLAEKAHKRNRAGAKATYEFTGLRGLIAEESARLFAAQRDFGNPASDEGLRAAYEEAAFTQRPLKSVADMVGFCIFYPEERRAPKHAPSAEGFRLAQCLTNLRIRHADGNIQRIVEEDTQRIVNMLGSSKGITFKQLRKMLRLEDSASFEGLIYGKKDKQGNAVDPEKNDIVTKGSTPCGQGSYALHKRLGAESFARLRPQLDLMTKIIADNDDIEAIDAALRDILAQADHETLMQGVREGDFAAFRGTMSLSIKAIQAIMPHLIAAGDYAAGCELAGFDHAAERQIDSADIRNPVVARIMREVRQQCRAIMRAFDCIPGKVHVELLREVGKSVAERNEITRGLKERSEERTKSRTKLAELWNVPVETISTTELLRYELWRAQGCKCAYYTLFSNAGGAHLYQGVHEKGAIPIDFLRDSAAVTQIDHILPHSRTFDNSFHNMCLCLPSANQAKGNRTPFEWLGTHPEAWHAHTEWVKSLRISGLKKRNFLLENLNEDMEGRFHTRNLVDSSYAARLVKQWFEQEYQTHGVPMYWEDGSGRRRIFARPGAVTAWLRKEWGLEGLKKDADGKRMGDRHHALDALILACCSESQLQRVVKILQQRAQSVERLSLPAPWEGFRRDAEKALHTVFVSRTEKGRSKGALHEETLRSIRHETQEDGSQKAMLYIRKQVTKLKEADLENLKDPHRSVDVRAALENWFDKGAPKDTLPILPSGDIIRHVRVREGAFSSGITLKRGEGTVQADNANIVRTDVFTKKGKFYLVPVYTWHVAQGILPNKAAVGGKAEKGWLEMDTAQGFAFCFSLYPNSYVLTEKKDGSVREGYFIGTDRSTASITLALAHDREDKIRSIGVLTLAVFDKYRVDRLGNLCKVSREPRLNPNGVGIAPEAGCTRDADLPEES